MSDLSNPPFQLLRGMQFVAGIGRATVVPEIDMETYSEAGFIWNQEANKGLGQWEGPPGAAKGKKGLPIVGADNYARHPSTEVVCCAYDLKDGLGWRHWRPGLPDPIDLFEYLATGGLIEAWNVGFERKIWKFVCQTKYDWPRVHPWQWRCAMAKSRANSLPPGLDWAARVLGTTRKDPRGTALMKKFSMPRNPTKGDPRTRIMIEQEYADGMAYIEYNHVDIVAEAEASIRSPDLEGEELDFWLLDQEINDRGAPVDRQGVLNCIAVVEQVLAKYDAELMAMTGIEAASKTDQIKGWMHGQGVHMDSIAEDEVDAALARELTEKAGEETFEQLLARGWSEYGLVQTGRMKEPKYGLLPANVRRVLEIRQAAGSASVKKVFAMYNRMTADDRICDLYVYHGARTGRVTGEGPQATNLPKAGPANYRCGYVPGDRPWLAVGALIGGGCGSYYGYHTQTCPHCGTVRPVVPNDAHGKPVDAPREWSPDAALVALAIIGERSVDRLEQVFGDALHAVAGALRALYMAGPGKDFISSDFSSIEAVVIAAIAGEDWRLDVFRTHGNIYLASASQMFGIPFDDMVAHKKQTGQHHPKRAYGKIAELALGFGGWIPALKAFGCPGTDDELKAIVLKWWAASPHICWLWGGQTVGKANGPLANANRMPKSVNRYGEADRWDKTPFLFGVEGAVVSAIQQPGEWFEVKRMDGSTTGVAYIMKGTTLFALLPSGRFLKYHMARLVPQQGDRDGWAIEFEGWNTNPKNGPVDQWITIRTFGGRLVENLVQAIARDILRFAMLNLAHAGYDTVMHTYDEVVAEVQEGLGSVEQVESIMSRPVEWATYKGQAWPVKAAGGWRDKRYRKEA